MNTPATDTPKPAVGSATPVDQIASMNLWQKLAAITGEIGSIAKDGKNAEQKYSFIEYAAVAGALRTLFSKYHVVCIPNMGERSAEEIISKYDKKGLFVTIKFTFTFKNADKPNEVEVINWIGEAADYGDKATNKAATGALKYCLMRTFNVSEKGDEDPDSQTPDLGEQRSQDRPPKRITMRDAITQVYKALKGKGFTTAEDCKAALLALANVTDVTDLKPDIMDHVSALIETMSGQELREHLGAAEKTEEVAS
jgi:hypothetical protein